MTARSFPLLVLGLLVLGRGASAQRWEPGLLLTPFSDSTGKSRGQAGDTISYRDTPRSRMGFDIQFNGETFTRVWQVRLAPRGSPFLPYFIYDLLDEPEGLYTENPKEELRRRVQLASSASELFQNHPYHEHFAVFACRAVLDQEAYGKDGKSRWGETLACLTKYLRDFPTGKYRDEMEWLKEKYQHYVYEFAGGSEVALGQASAFQAYLRSHPRTRVRAEIESSIAYLYRIAYELRREEALEQGLSKPDTAQYRILADSLYSRVARSQETRIAARAQVALMNLRSGRRVYIDPNGF